MHYLHFFFFDMFTQEGKGEFELVTSASWCVVPNRLSYSLKTIVWTYDVFISVFFPIYIPEVSMADKNNLDNAQDPNGQLLELVRWASHERYEILWLRPFRWGLPVLIGRGDVVFGFQAGLQRG
jgi:hypothetical protein